MQVSHQRSSTMPTSCNRSRPATGTAPANLSPLYVKLTLVALLWGGTFIAGRVAAPAMPLALAAWIRFAIAAVLFVVLARLSEGGLPRLDRRQVLHTALPGLTGIFLYNLLFLGALARLPAGRTALLVSLNPALTAVAAALFCGERLGLRRWCGIALALLGATVVIGRGNPATLLHGSAGLGEALMLGAVACWAAYTLLSRRALVTLSPLAATAWSTLWGLLLLTPMALPSAVTFGWGTIGWPVWAALGYLGAFGTVVAFVWYYQGIDTLGPSRTAVFNNLVPAFGVLQSALLLGEPVLASMLVGGALSALGVHLTNRQDGSGSRQRSD